MRYFRLLLTVVLLTIVGRANADNLEVANIEMIPGETKEMLISLSNPSKMYTAFQLDLVLPEGIAIAKNASNKLMVVLDEGRMDGDEPHILTVQEVHQDEETATKTYRFLAYSSSNLVFTGNSGTLLHITLQSVEDITAGDKTATIKNQVFTEVNGNQEMWNNITSTIKIVYPVITADDKSRPYGDENPAFTYTTSVEVSGEPTLTTTATKTSTVGDYDIVVGKGTIKGSFIAVNGKLTVTKAPLTITAKSYTITQGDALPTFDVEYSGFKNNETADILTKRPTLTTSVTSSSEPGTFDIVASGAEAQNYEISYVKGTLTINPGVYKLTYMVDGEVYKTYDVVYGTKITAEAEPTKEGYTFSGWSEIPETMPAHDVTVTGSFSINSYKLTYTVDGEVYKTYDIEYGATITPEAEPTKEGYTFSGWSEIPATMPAHDVTVTGSFSKGQYKLIYMVDGQTYKTISYDYGDAITPEPAPIREGYTFSGWSEIPATMPAHDVTVTGTFSINSYKLTYVVDGVEYKSYDIEYGATITPEAEPTKEGYTFSGWSTIPETMPAHDVTITGTFIINKYKLTYIVDGEVYKSYDIEYGASITPEAEPTKEGYTFSGWSTIPTTMPAYDVTITGSFTKGAYKLTYMLDGVVYKTISYDYGDAITPEPAPTKEGYTFSGWSTIPATMPAHDVMVTGTFSINKYKLTYTVDGEVYKTYEMEYGATITPETEPSKEGYTFSGWSTIPATMPAYDVTVTGTFKVNKYKVNYFVDNNPYYTDMVEYGAIITPPNVPEREGYDFAWVYIPDTMPAYDISIYGQYTIKTGIEEIMSNANGGVMIFTIDGKRVDNLKKGLNIVKLSNGTTRKVVVK
ncbi:MAG: InlB B-repeat-containing protein [Prevotella sp.]|nr:InlB B-repeat-containing protein [Prevotella sp.]